MKKQFKTICLTLIAVSIIIGIGILSFISQADARQGCCSHHGGVCGCRCCDGTPLSATCAPYYPSCSSTPKSISLPKTDYTTLTTTSAEVIRTVDGDTIEVKFSDGTIEKVRLIGIDTPETVDPRKPVECFGKEASGKMKELVNGKTVRLERKSDENRGSYGRLLRYVYVGDLFVNAEMIKQGYAYAYTKYPFDTALMEQFRQYEKEAREGERGLWAPGVCENENQTNESEQSSNTSSVENQSNETSDTTEQEALILNDKLSELKPLFKEETQNKISELDENIMRKAGMIFITICLLLLGLVKKTKK